MGGCMTKMHSCLSFWAIHFRHCEWKCEWDWNGSVAPKQMFIQDLKNLLKIFKIFFNFVVWSKYFKVDKSSWKISLMQTCKSVIFSTIVIPIKEDNAQELHKPTQCALVIQIKLIGCKFYLTLDKLTHSRILDDMKY